MASSLYAFDSVAAKYDELWDKTMVGQSQRAAVWRRIDRLFRPGQNVLDLGCGTGTDALHLSSLGVSAFGVDGSAEMVRISRRRGVRVRHLPFSRLGELEGTFDGVLSNFGALNCVEDLNQVAFDLLRLLRPKGYLAMCILGRVCAWEILHFVLRGKPGKAFRRLAPPARCSLGCTVTYCSVSQLRRVFEPAFRLVDWSGIGLFVPPSYVRGFSSQTVSKLARLDAWSAHLPGLRALSDHRLIVFQRL